MPHITVTRTHARGRKLHPRDHDPLLGPATMDTLYVAELNRRAECLRIRRGNFRDGRERPDALPPLFEPRLLTFGSEQGMMVAGFEQIDGHRYYQGWYIRWISDDEARLMRGNYVRTDKTGPELT